MMMRNKHSLENRVSEGICPTAYYLTYRFATRPARSTRHTREHTALTAPVNRRCSRIPRAFSRVTEDRRSNQIQRTAGNGEDCLRQGGDVWQFTRSFVQINIYLFLLYWTHTYIHICKTQTTTTDTHRSKFFRDKSAGLKYLIHPYIRTL